MFEKNNKKSIYRNLYDSIIEEGKKHPDIFIPNINSIMNLVVQVKYCVYLDTYYNWKQICALFFLNNILRKLRIAQFIFSIYSLVNFYVPYFREDMYI